MHFRAFGSTLDGKHVAGEGNCTEACEELKEGNSRLSTAVLRHCACESDWWRRAVFGHERSTQQSMPQSPLRGDPPSPRVSVSFASHRWGAGGGARCTGEAGEGGVHSEDCRPRGGFLPHDSAPQKLRRSLGPSLLQSLLLSTGFLALYLSPGPQDVSPRSCWCCPR